MLTNTAPPQNPRKIREGIESLAPVGMSEQIEHRSKDSKDDFPSRDASETGCGGLLEGWAVQKETGRRVHADYVRKASGPFYCPECYSDAVHRYCHEARHHFAHIARLSSIVRPGESELHSQCKRSIYEHLKERFPGTNWVCDDVVIRANQRRKLCALKPDIGGRIDGLPIAIEIQSSELTLPSLLRRSLSYSARDVSILWIVPLREALGTELFRPRLFERYLHSIYYGRIYYWYPGLGCHVEPVHYGVAQRHIPLTNWFEDGEEKEAGGYDRPYKRIRRPVVHEPVSIADNFRRVERDQHTPPNERKSIPQMKLFMDEFPHWWKPGEEELLRRFHPEDDDPIE